MVQRRDFGPVAGQMREALEKYSRDELADLITHITRVYIIEGKEPVLAETGTVSSSDNLRSLTFAQLILHLQMNLPHPELQQFRVSGDRVWAERNGHEVLVAGEPMTDEVPPDWDDLAPRDPPAARPVEQTRRRGVRAVTGPTETLPAIDQGAPPIGTPRRRRRTENTPSTVAREAAAQPRPSVSLRDEETPAPTVQNDWFSDTPPPPPSRGKKDAAAEDEVTERSDRFSMLELD